jgi:branched-chain amino acid transport system permease protein
MLGVPANLIISPAFANSGLLAGVVGILWIGRIGTVVPGIGLEPLLVAFIATVIGRHAQPDRRGHQRLPAGLAEFYA